MLVQKFKYFIRIYVARLAPTPYFLKVNLVLF